LRNCGKRELELGTAWPTQAQTTEPKDTLEMCKQQANCFEIVGFLAIVLAIPQFGPHPGHRGDGRSRVPQTASLATAAEEAENRRKRI
jgi:hypothetical protein